MTWLNPLSCPMPVRQKKSGTPFRILGKPTRQISRQMNERMRELDKLGWIHRAIADELGISRQSVSKHLAGKRKL